MTQLQRAQNAGGFAGGAPLHTCQPVNGNGRRYGILPFERFLHAPDEQLFIDAVGIATQAQV